MDNQIKRRCTHEVEHLSYLTRSDYGDKGYDTPILRMCYREGKVSMVRNTEGNEVVSSLRLYFDGLFVVSGNDLFVVAGEKYPVLAYSQYDGLRPGTGTTVVYL